MDEAQNHSLSSLAVDRCVAGELYRLYGFGAAEIEDHHQDGGHRPGRGTVSADPALLCTAGTGGGKDLLYLDAGHPDPRGFDQPGV